MLEFSLAFPGHAHVAERRATMCEQRIADRLEIQNRVNSNHKVEAKNSKKGKHPETSEANELGAITHQKHD